MIENKKIFYPKAQKCVVTYRNYLIVTQNSSLILGLHVFD